MDCPLQTLTVPFWRADLRGTDVRHAPVVKGVSIGEERVHVDKDVDNSKPVDSRVAGAGAEGQRALPF